MRNMLWEHPSSLYPKTGSDSSNYQLQNNYTRLFSILIAHHCLNAGTEEGITLLARIV